MITTDENDNTMITFSRIMITFVQPDSIHDNF